MKIVLVSDTHLAPRCVAFGANWDAGKRWIGEIGPDLVIHLGDITADGFDDPGELTLARAAFDGIAAPLRFVPGNHDIGDNPIAPGVATRHALDLARLAQYRVIFGEDRWTIEDGDWQLVGLNAQLLGTDSAEEAAQFDWLAAALAGSRAKLGLFIHKPLCRDALSEDEPHIRYVPAAPRRRLLELLSSRDWRFVASGHVHQARRVTIGAVEHVWAPSSAFILPDGMQERIGEKMVGVTLLRLGRAGLDVETVTPPGMARHNILAHAELYPGLAEIKTKLGAAALID
jgi:3',5'-cyclic AMP phosphodiesterase CpdA